MSNDGFNRASMSSVNPPSHVSRSPSVVLRTNTTGQELEITAQESTHAHERISTIPPDQVILDWTPSDLNNTRDHAINLQLQALQTYVAPSAREVEGDALPPRYEEARVLTVPITYSFSPSSANSMPLVPHESAADTRPLFHISVAAICFIPSSYTTTIRRGGTESGVEMGNFEMGLSARAATLCIREMAYDMDQVITRTGSRTAAIWQWRFLIARMTWSCNTVPNVCRLTHGQVLLARFTPEVGRRIGRRRDVPHLAKLEVTPEGQKYLDDIVMSILIIERKRLTPFNSEYKQLLNFA